MSNPFFEHPILNSPYECPQRHWELDGDGQPTQRIIEDRRKAQFISPIPKPKKRKTASDQQQFVFNEGKGLSTGKQQYDLTPIINELRHYVNQWRSLPNPNQWQVTSENDPYSALKTTLKAEINEDAWATLNSDTSRPFSKPLSGRIAVKVINHLGDEVMKVFKTN